MASKFSHPGLEAMGYKFNDNLEIRQIENGEPFAWQGQAHYDVLGDQVLEWIQDYMVSHYGLKEIWLGGEYPDPSKKINGEPSTASNSADGESKVTVAPLHWDKPTRSGIFTVKDSEVSRVNAHALQRHAKVNIFISENFYTADRVLIIVQGSGAVRPGQWARALCINQSLKAGTIFDYLDIARECNLGVIVLNPNQDRIRLRVISDEHPNGTFHPEHVYPILGHEDHNKHIVSIYDNFIAKTAAKDLFMVAHSRGGDSAMQLLNNRLEKSLIEKSLHQLDVDQLASAVDPAEQVKRLANDQSKVGTISADQAEQLEAVRRRADGEIDEEEVAATAPVDDGETTDLKRRLRALAFTDSVHWIGQAASEDVVDWVSANAKDWVASKEALDTPVPENRENAGCECVSAGHTKHEWTSPCAVNSVFEFFFSTIDNPPHFAPRQVPFSNPPQNMPELQPQDASHPSYAAIAAKNTSTADATAAATTPTFTPPTANFSGPKQSAAAAYPANPNEPNAPSYAAVASGEQKPVHHETTNPHANENKTSWSAVAAGTAPVSSTPPTAPAPARVPPAPVLTEDAAPANTHNNAPTTANDRNNNNAKPAASIIPTVEDADIHKPKPTPNKKPATTPKDPIINTSWIAENALLVGVGVLAAGIAAYYFFRQPAMTVRQIRK